MEGPHWGEGATRGAPPRGPKAGAAAAATEFLSATEYLIQVPMALDSVMLEQKCERVSCATEKVPQEIQVEKSVGLPLVGLFITFLKSSWAVSIFKFQWIGKK